MFLQKRPFYSEDAHHTSTVNPEMPGHIGNMLQCWRDVLGNVKGTLSCAAIRNVSCITNLHLEHQSSLPDECNLTSHDKWAHTNVKELIRAGHCL